MEFYRLICKKAAILNNYPLGIFYFPIGCIFLLTSLEISKNM